MHGLRLLLAFAIVLVSAACSRNTAPAPAAGDEKPAIEAALNKYLSERGTINVAAMDVKIEDLKIAGDRADAQVLFRTKQGEGEMRMSYVLTRQAGVWTVQAPPRSETGSPHRDVAPPPGAAGELPAGHPPVTSPTPPPKKTP